jgi:hypothetical protein
LHLVIDDNSETDDYMDDAPAETNAVDNGIEYEVQLDQQGMSIADALRIHHPSSDFFV